jgi:hypothetical protein
MQRITTNPYGGFALMVDKRIGNAYKVVKEVHDNLDKIAYLVENISADLRPKGIELGIDLALGYIQWRYTDQTPQDEWRVLCPLSAITGKQVEMQALNNWIQWRYVGDPHWENLLYIDPNAGGGGGGGGGGVSTPVVPITPQLPASGNYNGELTWTGSGMYLWDGTQWVNVVPDIPASVTIVDALPATGTNGQVVMLSTDGKLYVWKNGAWQAVAADITPADVISGLYSDGLRGVEYVSALPDTGNVEGRLVYNQTDGKMYIFKDGAWVSFGDYLTPAAPAAIEVVSSLPTTGNFDGRTVFNTADSKLYQYANGNWSQVVEATGVATDVADGAITTAKFAAGITPVEILTALPTTGNFAGRMVYNTTDGKLYRYVNGAWTAAVQAADILGQLQSGQLAANSVTAGVIAAGAISASQIAAGAITTDKLAAGAITSDKIAANSIKAGNIAANTITSSQIAADTITAGNIAAGAIGVSELAAGSVTANALAANSITAAAISAGSITASALAAGSVTAGALQAGSVTANALAANSITAGKIAAGAISADQIGAGTLAAGVAYTGQLTANQITTGSLTGVSIGIGAGKSLRGYAFDVSSTGVVSVDNLFGYTASFSNAASDTTGVTPLSSTSQATAAVALSGAGLVSGGNCHGVRGRNNSTGAAGLIGGANGYDFYADGSGINYGPFTGSHDALLPVDNAYEPGDLIVDSQLVLRNGWSNTIFLGSQANQVNQKAVIGVLALKVGPLADHTPAVFVDEFNEEGTPVMNPAYDQVKDQYILAGVNALGEGQLNVCGRGGNLEAGDLVVASDLAGKAQKQADDLVHSYTVARVREAVSFASPDEVKQVACVYLCG